MYFDTTENFFLKWLHYYKKGVGSLFQKRLPYSSLLANSLLSSWSIFPKGPLPGLEHISQLEKYHVKFEAIIIWPEKKIHDIDTT